MRIDVTTDTPWSSYILCPCAGKSPTADVDRDVLVYFVDAVPDGSIAFLFIQAQYISAAIVYLDKVESPIAEIELGVLLLMSVNTGTYSCMIVVPDRTASVVARICINTGFHSKTMYMVGNRFHSIRETVFVGLHFSIAISFAEETIININIMISCVFQTFFNHQVGLIFNNIFTDIYSEGIPWTPTHNRGIDCFFTSGLRNLSFCTTNT